MAEPLIPKTEREREAWMDGFLAAHAINAGRRDLYERFRDAYLEGRDALRSDTTPT